MLHVLYFYMQTDETKSCPVSQFHRLHSLRHVAPSPLVFFFFVILIRGS